MLSVSVKSARLLVSEKYGPNWQFKKQMNCMSLRRWKSAPFGDRSHVWGHYFRSTLHKKLPVGDDHRRGQGFCCDGFGTSYAAVFNQLPSDDCSLVFGSEVLPQLKERVDPLRC
ncbi:unnamed protein product [Dibothriocephalus latus]|uniref:Uncharacterized protein n=1 Tax=Dibothriocephalus latus TaxID=60516 RepID=A0A3P7M0P4_DIBLA|nr:unnamed protein product [Dibothriocephalus latus]